jgi:hypothetical protein
MSAATSIPIRFCVRLDRTPGALERLLLPFTVLGVAPRNMVLRPAAGGTTFVVLDVLGLDPERCAVLTQRILQAPCVRRARFMTMGMETRPCENGIDALDAVA